MSNTARIAKNTLALYFRQIVVILVALYTVRVELDILGVQDYGIYNIVAGIVVLFSFINSAMTGSTQRFLNFAIGQNDPEKARNVFSLSVIIHLLIALFIILIAETLGYHFLLPRLNIPEERQSIAFIVYHFTILTVAIKIMQVPFRAVIIANEKMSFFALFSIIEVSIKLIGVFILYFINYDKLLIYGLLFTVIALIHYFILKLYCNKMFTMSHFKICKDKQLFKELVSFSGWSVFGEFSLVASNRGTNILLNLFFGVTANAAMGIAQKINNAVHSFVTNFQTAFKPQIIKSYAAGEHKDYLKLIFRASKFSYFLMLLFAVPLFVNLDFVLLLWLNEVPVYTLVFIQLMLIHSLETAFATPFLTAVNATGKIKKFQIVSSCFIIINFPLSFIFLNLGYGPFIIIIIKIIMSFLQLCWRTVYLKKNINLPILRFLKEVIFPSLLITFISGFITIFSFKHIQLNEWAKLFISCSISTICIGLLVYFVGLSKNERNALNNWIKTRKNGYRN